MFLDVDCLFLSVHVSNFFFALPPLVLFEDRTFDGSGQPSVQEAPETKNSFKKEEAQDQGPALRSKTRLSEVHGKHSSMSQSSNMIYPDTVFMAQLKHRANKKKNPLQTIRLPPGDGPVWLSDLSLFHILTHLHTASLMNRAQSLHSEL